VLGIINTKFFCVFLWEENVSTIWLVSLYLYVKCWWTSWGKSEKSGGIHSPTILSQPISSVAYAYMFIFFLYVQIIAKKYHLFYIYFLIPQISFYFFILLYFLFTHKQNIINWQWHGKILWTIKNCMDMLT
jgi:hypothetical protein